MKRVAGFSYLRIVATLGVVLFHTFGILYANQNLFSMTSEQSNFFSLGYHLMYWAVPCFYMISGGVLLNKNKTVSYEKVLKKYLPRMILVLVIFGIPFSIMMRYAESRTISVQLFVDSVLSVVTGNSLSHLWYVYSIIGIYLILPVLQATVNSLDEKQMRILLSVLFLFSFVLPTISRITELRIAFVLPLSYCVFYVLVGYYINQFQPTILKNRLTCMITALVGLGVIGVMHGLVGDVEAWIAYDAPLVAIAAIALYSFFVLTFRGEPRERIWEIDRLCFGVYIVHPVFIQFCYRVLHVIPVGVSSYKFVTFIMWLLFSAISIAVSWLLSKIGYLRKYVL